MTVVEYKILKEDIKSMTDFIANHGEAAFREAVYHGAWEQNFLKILHPIQDTRNSEKFDVIFDAFLNAYV